MGNAHRCQRSICLDGDRPEPTFEEIDALEREAFRYTGIGTLER